MDLSEEKFVSTRWKNVKYCPGFESGKVYKSTHIDEHGNVHFENNSKLFVDFMDCFERVGGEQMIVAKVVDMRFNSASEDILSMRKYKDASEWLSRWTCENNFKMMIGEDYDEIFEKARYQAVGICEASGYHPSAFEINIQYCEVEDGMFWNPSVGRVGYEQVVV